MATWNVIPFIAPGALLGLGVSLVANFPRRWRWTWRAAARSAAIGGFVLAPLLTFFVGIEGNMHPRELLSGFVRAAWGALAIGAVLAVLHSRRVGPRAHRHHPDRHGGTSEDARSDKPYRSGGVA